MGSSLNQAQLNFYNREWKVGRVADDEGVLIRLKYIGSGSVTSVTVDTDQDLTFVTSDGGTDAYLFSTYTTLGALVDAINSDGIFSAKLLDGLRADLTAGSPFVDNASLTITSAGYYDCLIDNSVDLTYNFRATFDRGTGGTKPTAGHGVHIVAIDYNVDVGTAAANGIRIYKWNPNTKVEEQIWGKLNIDGANSTANDTSITFQSGNGMISSGVGNDLIVRVIDAGSITDRAVNFLQVSYICE